MGATPPHANISPDGPAFAPALQGVLLQRVRAAWAEACALDTARHAPFVVAVGAVAVYARACGVPVADVVSTLHAVLAADLAGRPGPADPPWRTLVRDTVVVNYHCDD